MTSGPRPAILALLLALGLGAGPALAAPTSGLGLPWRLSNPLRGGVVEVAPGPRVLHVVFFATWCPPCLAELQRLQELEATWGRQGYRLVLIAVPTRQTRERLRAFVEREAPPGSVLFDAEGEAQRAAQVEDLPAHLLIGPDGGLLVRGGALTDVTPELERRLGMKKKG